jgi:hypothetical protein
MLPVQTSFTMAWRALSTWRQGSSQLGKAGLPQLAVELQWWQNLGFQQALKTPAHDLRDQGTSDPAPSMSWASSRRHDGSGSLFGLVVGGSAPNTFTNLPTLNHSRELMEASRGWQAIDSVAGNRQKALRQPAGWAGGEGLEQTEQWGRSQGFRLGAPQVAARLLW